MPSAQSGGTGPPKHHRVPVFRLRLVRDGTLRVPRTSLDDAPAVVDVARVYLGDRDCEFLIVLMLGSANELCGVHTVGVGGRHGVQVRARDVFKAAIIANASGSCSLTTTRAATRHPAPKIESSPPKQRGWAKRSGCLCSTT